MWISCYAVRLTKWKHIGKYVIRQRTNFQILQYGQNKSKVKGVYSQNNLPNTGFKINIFYLSVNMSDAM